MNHNEAFLRAIRACPNDDAPRLIYADWLEERGDPLGEFIRVECELARLRRDEPRFRELWARELELIRRHKDEWFGRVRQALTWWDCRRGFMDECRMNATVFLASSVELFRYNPVVRHVQLTASAEHLPAMAWCRDLERVTHLDLNRHLIGDPGLRGLAISPHLGGLRVLELRECGIGPEGARALAETPHLARLEWLDLGNNQVGVEGIEALLNSPHFVRPRGIKLNGAEIGGLESGNRGQLQPNIGNDGVLKLAAAPAAARLTHLDLSWNDLQDNAFRALAASPYLNNLTSLWIWEERFRSENFSARREPGLRALGERFGKRMRISGYVPPLPEFLQPGIDYL